MKKISLTILMLMFANISMFAQLTGTKTIPGNYASVQAAIADLNVQGAGAGGVDFIIAADYKETFSTPLAGYITTTTGSATKPIRFLKSGAGSNPVITAPAGSGSMDAIIAVTGCDYVTFDGLTLQENMDNYDDLTYMEWGFAILKASGTNGSQNITIKNCRVNLNLYYEGSTGIYASNHTQGSPSQLSVTNVTGANSFLKIYRNSIENCYRGIYLSGYADPSAPYAYYDQGNEIGKDGGDTITNVGGGTTAGYGIYAKYQNNLKVAYNKITSTMGGEQPHYGIYLTTALNASYDLYGNNVSMQFYGTGPSASFYPIQCDMGGSGTNNTVNVYNNTVSGCNFPTTSNSNQYAYYMYLNNLGVTSNVYGNIISNNTTGAEDVLATGRVWYLSCNMVTNLPGTLNLHDNSVSGNARIQSVPGYGLTNCLMANGNGASLNMYNNSVSDIIIASSQGTNVVSAIMNAATRNIYNNTVINITRAEGPVSGLYTANYLTGISNIFNNKVQDIEGLTNSSNITGIYHAAGNTSYYYNNYVSDLRAMFATTSSGLVDQVNGISISQGTDIGVYNNTVFLSAPAPSGQNFGSSALFINSSAIVDYRNNVLVNTSAASGTGKTAAVRILGNNGTGNVGMSSNYNDLFAGTPDPAHLLFSWYDNSAQIYHDDITLAAYKSRMYPREAQAVTELPPFVNVSVRPYNIHLQSSVATQCEAGGSMVTTPIVISDDFDHDPRYPASGYPVNISFTPNAPDIGADETGGLPNDITAPAISYNPLLNTNSGSLRTLTVTINDGSGVPASGTGLPVLYWKVNAGSYQGVQAVPVTGNIYTFSFGSGAVLGDVVSYYVAAQDNAVFPNVTSFPLTGAGVFSYNPPACQVPPGTPSTYSIIPGIEGVFHVGVGKDFSTLTASANMINARVLTGPVTLILDDAAYTNESFPVSFTANPGSSAVNTLTIKPNTGVSPVISTGDAAGILNVNGIDFFFLDGSNNGTNSKNLQIRHTSTSIGYSYGISVQNYNFNDPATNVTIKNCIIRCTPVHSSVIGRFPVTFSNIGGGYDNFIIDNNTIIGGLDGIRLMGANTAISHNGQITNNIIGSMTDSLSTITRVGIYTEYADNTLISGNEIIGPYTGSLNAGITGISIYRGCTNTKIRRNRIHEMYNNNPYDGWGASGIEYGSDASTVTEISNNLIYDIKGGGSAPGLAGTNPYGILLNNGGNLKILFNTISLTGPYLSSINDASAACIGISHKVADNSVEIRNNILQNSMVCNGAPNTFGKAYGIILDGQPTVFSNINNNDYFIDGYQGMIGQQFLQTGMIDYQTLAAWQVFTGQEANSVSTDPAYAVSPVLKPTSAALNNKGTFIGSVPADIDDLLRTNPPDIGAYEFGPDPLVATLSASAISGSSAAIHGTVNPAGNVVSTFFDYGKTTTYTASAPATPGLLSGTATTGFQITLSGLEGLTVYHYRARTVTTGGLVSYGADSIFTTAVASVIPVNTTVTNSFSNDTCFNATQTITVAGSPNTFVVTPTGHVTMIAGHNIFFLPGTSVQAGGYLLGRITTTEEYCGTVAAPVVATKSGVTDNPPVPGRSGFSVYPNPTTGIFTLGVRDENVTERLQVEVFNILGNVVQRMEFTGAGKHIMSLQEEPSGIYLVRIATGAGTEVKRILKQ